MKPEPIILAWLVGFNLRAAVLAVPPVLPQLRADLHLSFSLAGALISLPILCMGAAAIPGALLSNRVGARSVVGAATLVVGLAALARLLPPEQLAVFLGTLALGLAIAVAQPAAAVVIREWYPRTLQRASTIYALGINAGGIAGATATVYLLSLFGWRGTFIIWALPAIVIALLWMSAAPEVHALEDEPHSLSVLIRDRGVWRAAGLFGGQSLAYFTTVGWIPFLLRPYGQVYLSIVLLTLGGAVLAGTAVLAMTTRHLAVSPRFYIISGSLVLAGAAGLSFGLRAWALVLAALIGLGAGLTFAGVMAMPPILARSNAQVAGYAGLMLTAGYFVAFFGPLIGGFLLDQTGIVAAPFWLVVGAGAVIAAMGLTLVRREAASFADR